MNKGIEIARGKTKVLFEAAGQPDMLVVKQTDSISAGDGARRNEIAGKGRLAAQTTARVFRLLNLCGLPTHYLNGGEDDDDNEMLVRRCNMIPLEVVVRGVAAGSLVRRNPGLQRGSLLVPRMVEFFLKDDANHDPLITPDEILSRTIANPAEVSAMTEIARLTFEILAHAWRKRDVLLVDLKIEFGRLAGGENKGQLVIADVIDNDSWRIWPQGREDRMLDKQMYRNLETVDDAALAQVKNAYEQVADMVGAFPVMRPGMIALFAESLEQAPQLNAAAQSLAQLGLPLIRHVASATKTPGYVLQLLQQHDATFARLMYVAFSGADGALRTMLENGTSNPVLDGAGEAAATALKCAKILALEDTVLFGRTLLIQTNARSAVLQADAQLNAQPPPQTPTLA
ncbi:MAG TPA: phosphoribosylaminoimidazolesuccinocarboxamide synthase [Candidatus Baltobacteraceae bacterium]|nr:phosphoribosylaminoimidazolesuccinocarboxamide synthase [Candidatus Baltobacteraceae bacterium]